MTPTTSSAVKPWHILVSILLAWVCQLRSTSASSSPGAVVMAWRATITNLEAITGLIVKVGKSVAGNTFAEQGVSLLAVRSFGLLKI